MLVGFDSELVFLHDFVGYGCAVYTEVLVVHRWGAEVEVFDVNAHVLGSFLCIRYGVVNVNFCVGDGDCSGY